jgi:CHAT domain-containing protein/tetratricopeptide (TPR) repeat protein
LTAELARLESEAERERFLSHNPSLLQSEVVSHLSSLILETIRRDARQALRLAESALLIAQRLDSKPSEALALRTKADALYACGHNRTSIEYHDRAYEIYACLCDSKEAARTLSHSIQPLILSGEYDRAFSAAQQARELFLELGDHKRLASLENNLGNIFHRQDRFQKALAHYQRAYAALAEYEEWHHAAIALSNMAMCLISLNDFPKSLDCYRKARELCVQHEMPRLRDQADYNIAYLYYLRGEYSRAIDMLLAARTGCEANGDFYHVALCYLDLSDIYLELNLSDEARRMADEGFRRFQKLDMRYESAKTLANKAIAYGQRGESAEALKLFAQAQKIFAREKNVVWQWLLDLYQALLLLRKRRYLRAQRLGLGAAKFFDQTKLSAKAVLAHLLLARIALETGDPKTAAQEVEIAAAKLSDVEAPLLVYQTRVLSGHIASRCGDHSSAYAAYQEARVALETLRGGLHREELKISFAKDRLEAYEGLVRLHFDSGGTQVAAEEAFSHMEAAKSRSMVETLLRARRNLRQGPAEDMHTQQIRELRSELNWYYHRVELEQFRAESSGRTLEQLLREVRVRESQLLEALRELPMQEPDEAASDFHGECALQQVQAEIPANAAVLEYFSDGDRLIAAVITPGAIHIQPVTQLANVSDHLHLLRFQLAKFRIGPAYTQHFHETLLRTTQSHLEHLYNQLVAPLRASLQAQHLIIVPHGPLHFLPFHALRNGDEYLSDSYTVSYAPSATLFASCQKKITANHGSLVFGIPDEHTAHIGKEAESVAALLPCPELCLGESANSGVLRERGPEVNFLHIATHGVYRQDNPMFSAIRLGDGYLNLYDLYDLRLNAKLVTLSGCATGMNFVAAGDELLGLQRGLFYAGASSLLLSLWDVNDQRTAELMQVFYRSYIQTGDMAGSLQIAMHTLRKENPHPYYWAPFVLVGKVEKAPTPVGGPS